MNPQEDKKIAPENVRRSYENVSLPSFGEVEKVKFIGQERAIAALRAGVEMRGDIFNVFLVGPPEAGKTTLVKDMLSQVAPHLPEVQDWCYVRHFKQKNFSYWIAFPKGEGAEFKSDIRGLVLYLMQSLLVEKKIVEQANKKMDMLVRQLRKKIEPSKWHVVTRNQQRPEGHAVKRQSTELLYEDEGDEEKGLYSREEIWQGLGNRTSKERAAALSEFEKISPLFEQLKKEVAQIRRSVRKKLENGDYLRKLKEKIIASAFTKRRNKYWGNIRAQVFLKNMEEDVFNCLGLFDLTAPVPFFQGGVCQNCQQVTPDECQVHGAKGAFSKYEVNLLVDNSETEGAPVVLKNVASYYDLFGKVAGEVQGLNTYRCDHMMILPGALHKANGGFLVIKANDLVLQPFFLPIWQRLVHALKNKEIKIETIRSVAGFNGDFDSPLLVEPIPLDITVILIGTEFHYEIFLSNDHILEFSRLFKIKAQMEGRVDVTASTLKQMVGFIKYYCDKEGLPLPEQKALARLVEFSLEEAESQEKLTLSIMSIKELLKEAGHYVKLADHTNEIKIEDIEQVLLAKKKRYSLLDERIQEYILKGVLNIPVVGIEVGQVNGLAVYGLGDYQFGKPSRILANVYLGRKGIVSIERATETSGHSFNKAVEIISSFFYSSFGREFPLSFSASIGFEQIYGGIEGDSASCAEIFVLLSVLSDVGIRQGIAVTGSVDKRGNVQAIGGVNHKVKAFFDVCNAKGLTGQQGVIIPQSNVKDLMLDKEIVQAVQEDKFHIWAIEMIEEGIEILTGMPYGGPNFQEECIYKKVFAELKTMSEKTRDFSKDEQKYM